MQKSQVGRGLLGSQKRIPFTSAKGPHQRLCPTYQRPCVSAAARYKIIEDAPVEVETLGGAPEPVVPEPAAVAPVEVPAEESVLNSLTAITDATSQATDVVSSAAADVTEAASNLASNATEAVSGLTDALTGSVSGLSEALSGGVGGLGDALAGGVGGLGEVLSGGVGGFGEALSGGVGGFGEALSGGVVDLGDKLTVAVPDIGGVFSGSVESLGSNVGSVTDGAGQAVQAATATVNEALSGVTGAFSGATSAVGETLTNTTQAASAAIENVTSTINSVTGGAVGTAVSFAQEVDQALGSTKEQIWSSIPPPAQDVLLQAGTVANSAAGLVIEYPLPALVVVGAVAVPAVINNYKSRFGGYAGELSAPDVLDLLSSDTPALLLDIRPEVIREKDGLPALKLGARFKAAALPLSFAQDQVALIDPRVVKNISNRDELVLAIHAAFVAELKQLTTPLAKVVIMDRDGSNTARDVARALRREGIFSAYVMQDGYKGWVSSELPTTTERGIDYDASAADLISDNIEVITEKTVELVGRLRDPAVAVPVFSTTALGAFAVYYYETTLQVIGLAGLSWSVYSELSKYESPQEAFETWSSGIKKVFTPKPKPVFVNGKPIPEDFIPPKLPPPPAAARAEEVLARAASEEAQRKKELAEMAQAALAETRAAAAAAAQPTATAAASAPVAPATPVPAPAKAPVTASPPATVPAPPPPAQTQTQTPVAPASAETAAPKSPANGTVASGSPSSSKKIKEEGSAVEKVVS